ARGDLLERVLAVRGISPHALYKMFSDSGRTSNWGETVTVDTVAGIGNGASQTLTIYGRVPAQTTPAPGTYTDTVTITVTY
ncbi:MAG TPA: spore coat U domain-containing protein, partial [Rhizobiales bacterium]|nr:spore coat U domain-containing protein [Hyphomicrobiales bacterium]